jgi:hypothetical protein
MKQIWRTYFLPADIDNGLIFIICYQLIFNSILFFFLLKDGSVVFDELLIYMKQVTKIFKNLYI